MKEKEYFFNDKDYEIKDFKKREDFLNEKEIKKINKKLNEIYDFYK